MSPQRRSFLLLEAAALVSGVGNGVAMVALPWLALERTGSASAAGLVATAAALPLIVASLVSGTVVDSFGRRRTAVVSDLLSLVAVAAIPIADATVGLSLGLLDEPPKYAASPDEEWSPTHSGVPLGEQSVPLLRDTAT